MSTALVGIAQVDAEYPSAGSFCIETLLPDFPNDKNSTDGGNRVLPPSGFCAGVLNRSRTTFRTARAK
jgi:hypothetical protein